MSFQIAGLVETPLTDLTLERSFSCMNSLMSFQVTSLHETLRTDLAFGLLIAV